MNYEQMANNRLHLCGTIISEPVFSHEIYGEGFYEMFLSVERLSEQKDILPITISERLIDEYEIKIGSKICFNGQFRSYNKLENGRSRLMLTVFVRDIEELNESKNPNLIYLAGYICKPTVYRTTPFSREICDVLLAINRAYNKSDYSLHCLGAECAFPQEHERRRQGEHHRKDPEPHLPEALRGPRGGEGRL